jgi:hypothetical protein
MFQRTTEMVGETREPRMKMYCVLMRVVGGTDVVVAESVYGVHAVRGPATVRTRQEAEELLGWFKKADWAVNAAGRSYYGRDMLLPVKWCIVEIDVPGEFLQD